MDERFRKCFVRPVCNILSVLPDRAFIWLEFVFRVHYFPNFREPVTFNEKMQWLKLNDRKPIYCRMADKYEVKKYVSEKIGSKFVISDLGIWKCFDDIDFDLLPNSFVLKCKHDSGGVLVVKDKEKLD